MRPRLAQLAAEMVGSVAICLIAYWAEELIGARRRRAARPALTESAYFAHGIGNSLP